MHRSSPKSRLKPALLACVAGLSFLTSPAVAQAVDSNKLLELMVTKGLVSRADADALLAEAAVAPAQPAAATQAPTFVGGVSGDTQTIPYIPQTVRDQIKSELRNELANQASSEGRSEEHTSELQSLMRISYAVFCLKKKKQNT